MKVSHIGLLFGLIGLGLAMPTFASTASICDAVSGNLVQNCGFELGNFNEWTSTPASSGSAFNATNAAANPMTGFGGPNSGSWDARFGATAGVNDYIDQSLTTITGDYYTVSFYVSTNANGGVGTGQFVANWNGGNILTITNGTQTGTGPDVPAGYDLYSFTEQATSTSTDLQFGGNNKNSYYHLDDIVVTQNTSTVPEPSSVSFVVAGLFGILVIGRRYMQKRTNS